MQDRFSSTAPDVLEKWSRSQEDRGRLYELFSKEGIPVRRVQVPYMGFDTYSFYDRGVWKDWQKDDPRILRLFLWATRNFQERSEVNACLLMIRDMEVPFDATEIYPLYERQASRLRLAEVLTSKYCSTQCEDLLKLLMLPFNSPILEAIRAKCPKDVALGASRDSFEVDNYFCNETLAILGEDVSDLELLEEAVKKASDGEFRAHAKRQYFKLLRRLVKKGALPVGFEPAYPLPVRKQPAG